MALAGDTVHESPPRERFRDEKPDCRTRTRWPGGWRRCLRREEEEKGRGKDEESSVGEAVGKYGRKDAM